MSQGNKNVSINIKSPNQAVSNQLGPIDDLEAYVSPEWWRNIFTSLYLKTDGDVVEDPQITKNEVDLFLDILAPKADSTFLDLCCGHGRHSLEIMRRGYHIDGFDRSHFLIRKARKSAKKANLNIKFKEGDARKLPFQVDLFDYVLILGNSFGYFESTDDDLRVLREVSKILKPYGKLLIDIADGDFLKQNFQPRSWEWIDKKLFVCRERMIAKDKRRLISREVITHASKGIVADQFYSERLYSRDELESLLKKAGFSSIEFGNTIEHKSSRNQDLGMMENRFVVTAQVVKEWTPIKVRSKKKLKNVIVLMGDPEKKDIIKPQSVFGDDDFYTINQLKSALLGLKEYQFHYLSNHDRLHNDLNKLKEKSSFVLNLCDEGFNNEALMELHIPAILEILKFDYSGSSPRCLAYCYDKSLTRGIADEMGIPVPKAVFIQSKDFTYELPFDYPVIIKPNFGDSSFGITADSVAENMEKLILGIDRIRDLFGYDKPILVEELLIGSDISLGIIGNYPDSYTVLPIIEEDYSTLPPEYPRICGYEAKWLPDSPYGKIKSIKANLPEETEKLIEECCLKLWERLDCRDYCRFDWRLDAFGNPRLLEVNPNPGWCWDGHLAKMAEIAGISYPKMLEMILHVAEARIATSNNYKP
ncbi:MAG: methyltransferase domain-containing protein [Deltaproteobacteria bacterium]|nr:methyltransferase domain-containing protein [Deltaproteobacteria bacterium]